MMEVHSKIFVAGHNGMVGSALVRKLKLLGYQNISTAQRSDVNLINQAETLQFFEKEKPEFVFLAAAKVGGIFANQKYKAEFLYENLMIEANVIHSSYIHGVHKLLFLGSSCIYPKYAPQPLKEEYLLTGALESTNEAYAIAKIAGIKLCESYRLQYGCDFISVMPTNLYGPGDNYHEENSHVVPALIQKFHRAKVDNVKSVTLWGSGTPKREFMHVDDVADACVFLMQNYSDVQFVNIGSGEEYSILELAHEISEMIGFKGTIEFDASKPDGTPRKLMDSSTLHGLGWHAKILLKQGLRNSYEDYLNNTAYS